MERRGAAVDETEIPNNHRLKPMVIFNDIYHTG